MSAQPPLPDRPAEPPNVSMTTGLPVGVEPAGSPRLSFKGWLFAVWLTKNKGFVKTVLAPVSAVLTLGGALDVATLRYVGIVLGLGLVTITFKLGFDAFDYFVSEQPPAPGAGA